MTTPLPLPEKTPPLTEIKRALGIAVYVFVITFLTGLVSEGLNMDHVGNAVVAGEAAIAAFLATLGFEVFNLGRRFSGPSQRPAVTPHNTP